jgi:hypothetical protein
MCFVAFDRIREPQVDQTPECKKAIERSPGMHFYFHVVSEDHVYIDESGVDCQDLATAISELRAAIAELSAEKQLDLSRERHLVVNAPHLEVVLVFTVSL